jgi:hypothetical protein
VLGGSDETSSLAVSLSSVVDSIEGRVDVLAANGVHLGARLALAASLSHFPKLGPELELLGSGHNVDLIEGQLDALWALTLQASKSLAFNILPSVAHDSPDDIGGE